jgi:hypothetical protein
MQKVFTIHLPRNVKGRTQGASVRLTPELVAVLGEIGAQYERPELRITNEGLTVSCQDWKGFV